MEAVGGSPVGSDPQATADFSDSNPGTLTGGPVWSTTTPFTYTGNRAILYDGLNDYVDVGDPANLFFPGAFSISAWVRRDASGVRYILGDYDSPGLDSSYALRVNSSGTVSFFWENSSTFPMATSTTVLTLGTYYHLVGTWDGTTRRLYVNATLEGINSTPQSRPGFGQNTTFGRAGNFSGLYFNGLIDEVGIWNYALNQDEVDWLNQNSLNNLGAEAIVPEPSALPLLLTGLAVVWLPFRLRAK